MYRLTTTIRLKTIEADNSHWAFDIGNGKHYELNETAFGVLRGIESRRTTEEIAAELASGYEIPVSQAESDVEEALQTFLKQGLVTKEESP